MNNQKHDRLFKLLILGEARVGKTCMLVRYTEDYFIKDHMQTVGFDYKIKTIDIDGYVVALQIWDTNGQERFHTVTKQMMKNAQGIILTYDITERPSFERISNWADQLLANADDEIAKVLVGNKVDSEDKRQVTIGEGEVLAEKHGIKFYEASAMNNININEVFEHMARELLNKIPPKTKSISISKKTHLKKNTGCCS